MSIASSSRLHRRNWRQPLVSQTVQHQILPAATACQTSPRDCSPAITSAQQLQAARQLMWRLRALATRAPLLSPLPPAAASSVGRVTAVFVKGAPIPPGRGEGVCMPSNETSATKSAHRAVGEHIVEGEGFCGCRSRHGRPRAPVHGAFAPRQEAQEARCTATPRQRLLEALDLQNSCAVQRQSVKRWACRCDDVRPAPHLEVILMGIQSFQFLDVHVAGVHLRATRKGYIRFASPCDLAHVKPRCTEELARQQRFRTWLPDIDVASSACTPRSIVKYPGRRVLGKSIEKACKRFLVA